MGTRWIYEYKRKSFSYLFIILSSFTFAQSWSLMGNETITEVEVFNNVYLNGHTLTIQHLGSFSAVNVYGNGEIISIGVSSLSMCNYTEDIEFNPDDFEVLSLGTLIGSLGIEDYTQEDLIRYGKFHVYDLQGRLHFIDDFDSQIEKRVTKGKIYIIILYIRTNILTTKKIIIK